MKLSDVSGSRTFDVLADCIGPIANLTKDEGVRNILSGKGRPEGMSGNAYLMQQLQQYLPKVLKTHKKDIIAILASIEGVTPKQYESELTLSKLLGDCYSLLTDEDLLSLFTSAPGNTAGQN